MEFLVKLVLGLAIGAVLSGKEIKKIKDNLKNKR